LRSICGEKPKAKGVTRPFTPYIVATSFFAIVQRDL
jgi:hypothetical protein